MIKALPSSVNMPLKTEMIFSFYCVFFQILPQQSGHAPKINKGKSPHAAQHQHHIPAAKIFSLSLSALNPKCGVPHSTKLVLLSRCSRGACVVWEAGAGGTNERGGSGLALGQERSPLEEEQEYSWGSCFASNQASCLRKCQTLLRQGQMYNYVAVW